MSKIFINYRRNDSATYASRLYDRLVKHFGADHLFIDIDQIEPGEDLVAVLQKKLQVVQVAVVLIGKSWLDDSQNESRQHHLDNLTDWVQFEIVALLQRKIQIIPVLVGGASFPKISQLPEAIAPLLKHHAFEIRDTRFDSDVDRLIQLLEAIIQLQMTQQSLTTYSNATDSLGKDSTEDLKHPILNATNLATNLANINEPKPKTENGIDGHVNHIITCLVIIAALISSYWLPILSTIGLEKKGTISSSKSISETSPSSKTPSDQIETLQSQANPKLTNWLAVPIHEPAMARIPPGVFIMGSPSYEYSVDTNEAPQRRVTINYKFEIGKYEVTFTEYDQFAYETQRPFPSDEGWGRGNRPVINVNFHDALAYVEWLSARTGKKYRLPTEAEWEYVASAGTATIYWWGNHIGRNNAVCNGCGSQWDNQKTTPVGSFNPNAFGVYDTAGNVWEWTQDCRHDTYQNAPTDGSAWLENHDGDCTRRVIRGGSWNNNPQQLRSSGRFWNYPDVANNILGFRVARDF